MGKKSVGPHAPSRARASERRKQALSLRKAGASFREIADALTISVGQAYADVESAMSEITRPVAEDLLSLELERLNTLQMSLWSGVKQGDVASVNAARQIVELRCRLFGLLRPAPGVTVNTSVPPPTPQRGVIVIQGQTKEQYIAGLKAARGELELSPRTVEFPAVSTNVDTYPPVTSNNGNGNGHHPTQAGATDGE
jgi:hypothetical protein